MLITSVPSMLKLKSGTRSRSDPAGNGRGATEISRDSRVQTGHPRFSAAQEWERPVCPPPKAFPPVNIPAQAKTGLEWRPYGGKPLGGTQPALTVG